MGSARCATRRNREEARRARAVLAALALLAAAGCSAGSGGPAPGLEEARASLERGEPEAAIQVLRGLASERPSDPEVAYWLGVALREAGRPSEALFPLGKAARSQSYAVRAGTLSALTLSELGNYEASIDAAERVLARDPAHEGALLARTRAALALERGELALESAERLLEEGAGEGVARQLRAAALAQLGRVEDAERAFRALMEAPAGDDPLSAARACVALAELRLGELAEPRSPAEARRPLDASEREAVERGTATLAECEERYGDRPAAVRAIAQGLARIGRDEEATAVLRRGVEASPGHAGLRRALGARLVAQDRFEEAESLVLERIEASEPSATGAAPWLSLASIRQLASDPEGALAAVEEALALQSTPAPSALFTRADLLVTLGRTEEAEAVLDELGEPLYRRALEARLAQARRDPARALELYESVIGEWPHNHRLRVNAALAALELGETERAKRQLLEAYRAAPSRTDAALWLARIHFAEGDYAEAAAFAGRHVRARGTVAPDAYVLAARCHARAGRRAIAREQLARLAEARDGRFAATALAERARLTAEARGHAAALAELEEAIGRRALDLAAESSAPALRQLVELLVRAGRRPEAEARVDSLLEERPRQPALLAMRGRLALLRGARAEAEQAFARALAIAPREPSALAGRALLARERGELRRAAEALDEAWEAGGDPQHGYMAGRTHLDLGDPGTARRRFEEVLRGHPDHAATANDLAWLLAERGEALPRAQRLAARAARLAPGPEAYDTLGYVLLERGRLDEARAAFRTALERGPGYATARYHLALALREAGEPGKARAQLERALERPFAEAEEARALLVRLEAGASP